MACLYTPVIILSLTYSLPLITSISRDMGSATKAALILNRSVVQFRILGRPTDLSKSFLVIRLWLRFGELLSNAPFKVWPLTPYIWPCFWPCDLEVVQWCWACPFLPTIWIWWWSEVIKVVKRPFQGLTFDPLYLTLRVKIQNSAAWDLFVLTQGTFPWVYMALGFIQVHYSSTRVLAWCTRSQNEYSYSCQCNFQIE